MNFDESKKQHNASPFIQATDDYKTARIWLAIRAFAFFVTFISALFTNTESWIGIPAVLTVLGKDICGLYPIKFYNQLTFFNTDVPAREINPMAYKGMYLFYIMVTLSVIFLVLYFLSWLLSKKKVNWMIFGFALSVIEFILICISFILKATDVLHGNPGISGIIISFVWLYFIGRTILSYKKAQKHLAKTEAMSSDTDE